MMKELRMFPQITEEPEEGILGLEEEGKGPPHYSSTPSSSSSTESPPDTPASPNHETQVPCSPPPTITTEDADPFSSRHPESPTPDDPGLSSPPHRVRMRSLSGGTYRLGSSLTPASRHRRQSGDDVLTRVSPSRKATLFEQFRPRSKSDSKGKRPTFLTTLKNSFLGGVAQRKTSLDSSPSPLDQLHPPEEGRHPRPRSGSETKGGTMSKMIELFRSRSNSVSYDSRGKMVAPFIPSDDVVGQQSAGPSTALAKRRKRSLFQSQRSADGPKREAFTSLGDDEAVDNRFELGGLDEEKIVPTFLSRRSCYDAMPKSGKVIVLSTELLVKNAFSCLVTNDIRAAPLWESATHTFVGMLTISDFINVLRHYYYSSREDIKSIENQKIVTWRRITNVIKPIVYILPNDSLLNAARLLLQERIHRLPVYDEKRNSVLFVITRRGLLQYLFKNLLERMIQGHIKAPSYLRKTIGELKSEIGTWENIAMVSVNTRVIDALDIFCERNVSAMPVMDDNNKLVDIFAKFDVFALAKEQTYDNLDMTISEALDKVEVHEDVYGCTLDESLGTVIDRFVAAKVHRLVVVDEKPSVIGMLSLSDILKFLVVHLTTVEEARAVSDTIDEAPEGAAGGSEESSVFLEPGDKAPKTLQQSSTLEHQESSDISEELGRLQVEDSPSLPSAGSVGDE